MRISLKTYFASLCLITSACKAEPNLVHQWLGDTNIVATVVGYQTKRTIGPWIEIPVMSSEGTKNGEETGVLFYVVAPTNYAGNFFWMHHDGLMASGYLASLYKTNTLYYFPFTRDGRNPGALHPEDFADLNKVVDKGPTPCTLRPAGWRYFCSIPDAENFISELAVHRSALEKELAKDKEKLTHIEPPPPRKKGDPTFSSERRRKYADYYTTQSDLQQHESRIKSLGYEIGRAQQQLDEMKHEAHRDRDAPCGAPLPHH